MKKNNIKYQMIYNQRDIKKIKIYFYDSVKFYDILIMEKGMIIMEKDITLLILAAGMGSRFGGLKQIEPLGPNDEFIIDYSIYDAKEAGFNKVVFIIKEENYEIFKKTIGLRVEPFIKVDYVFQKNEINPNDRKKPFGTAHAILCAKEKINEPFMMINADDFYGKDAFLKGADFLKNIKNDDTSLGFVGYNVDNTLTENGAVKRGVCKLENGYLKKLIESSIEKIDDRIIAKPVDGSNEMKLFKSDIVSMNMFLLSPVIFKLLESEFKKFSNTADLINSEFLITDVIYKGIKENLISLKVIETSSTWYGVTYKEDTDYVKESLKKLVDNKVYKNKLW